MLATLAHQGHQLGGSNAHALIYSATAATEADLVSHAFLKAPITCQNTRNALKVRTGTLTPRRGVWYGLPRQTNACYVGSQTAHRMPSAAAMAWSQRSPRDTTEQPRCWERLYSLGTKARMDVSAETQQQEGI